MKKTSRQINLFDISKVEHKSVRSDKIKTTDINILLNRVNIKQKINSKKKLVFSISIISIVSFIIVIVLCN